MLDYTFFGYFDRCRQINDILSKENYFLGFYERRNKFRFQLKKKLHNKNQMRRELSSCAIQKSNDYELLRNHLQNGERKDFVPIDVVYEPTLDEKKLIFCFFYSTNSSRLPLRCGENTKGTKTYGFCWREAVSLLQQLFC